MQEIGSDQPALDLGKRRVPGEGVLHLVGARLECGKQVAVTTLEVLEHGEQLVFGRSCIEPQNAIDDVVGASFVGRPQILWLDSRPERPDDDPGRIRSQVECLPV